jgi:chemotaxis protein CheX
VSLSLPAVLDQRTVEATRDQIASALGEGPLVVDGSGVERIATPGVHLLLAAQAGAAEAGVPFALVGASSALADTLDLLGLADRFPTSVSG